MKPQKARVRIDFDDCPIMDAQIIPKKKNFKDLLGILEEKLK